MEEEERGKKIKALIAAKEVSDLNYAAMEEECDPEEMRPLSNLITKVQDFLFNECRTTVIPPRFDDDRLFYNPIHNLCEKCMLIRVKAQDLIKVMNIIIMTFEEGEHFEYIDKEKIETMKKLRKELLFRLCVHC